MVSQLPSALSKIVLGSGIVLRRRSAVCLHRSQALGLKPYGLPRHLLSIHTIRSFQSLGQCYKTQSIFLSRMWNRRWFVLQITMMGFVPLTCHGCRLLGVQRFPFFPWRLKISIGLRTFRRKSSDDSRYPLFNSTQVSVQVIPRP